MDGKLGVRATARALGQLTRVYAEAPLTKTRSRRDGENGGGCRRSREQAGKSRALYQQDHAGTTPRLIIQSPTNPMYPSLHPFLSLSPANHCCSILPSPPNNSPPQDNTNTKSNTSTHTHRTHKCACQRGAHLKRNAQAARAHTLTRLQKSQAEITAVRTCTSRENWASLDGTSSTSGVDGMPQRCACRMSSCAVAPGGGGKSG